MLTLTDIGGGSGGLTDTDEGFGVVWA